MWQRNRRAHLAEAGGRTGPRCCCLHAWCHATPGQRGQGPAAACTLPTPTARRERPPRSTPAGRGCDLSPTPGSRSRRCSPSSTDRRPRYHRACPTNPDYCSPTPKNRQGNHRSNRQYAESGVANGREHIQSSTCRRPSHSTATRPGSRRPAPGTPDHERTCRPAIGSRRPRPATAVRAGTTDHLTGLRER